MVSFARVPEFTCQVAGCCQVFDSLEDYEHHYHTLHRNVCSFCRRAFPSVHLLDVHILEWHDSLFQILSERQDMVGDASMFLGAKGSHLGRRRGLSPSCLPSWRWGGGGSAHCSQLEVRGKVWGDSVGQDGGDAVSVSVSVPGGRLCREVQDQQRQERSPGEMSPLPCGLPI